MRYGPATLRVLAVTGALAVVLAAASRSHAEPQWFSDVASFYPGAFQIQTCGLCHQSFSGSGPRNAYGSAWQSAGGPSNAAAAFFAIEGDDSDGDGASNLAEIFTGSGFLPGFSCDDYQLAQNAPPNIVDYVDPSNPGCLTVTTTTTSTTTTTLGETPICSQPLSRGAAPTASDCLFILRTAVGAASCTPQCVCAPTGALPVSATDALLCLSTAVGGAGQLACPCSG